MIIEWNVGAVAQLSQGHGQSVWNWSGPLTADENRPICGSLAVASLVNGTLAVASVVSGTLSVASVVNGTLAIEDC